MENGRKTPTEKTRAEMIADKTKVQRRKQGDEKENETGVEMGAEAERARE